MRKILALLLLCLAIPAMAADNYTATPGAGLTFGAKDATSVYYPRHILCDNTTVAQCMSIDASGRPTVNINGTVTVTGAGGTFPATQSGTWTVQPGNTANTTAWLVTGTGGVFPSSQSGTWTIQPGNTANTTPWLVSVAQGGNTALVKAANTVGASDMAQVVAVANTNANGMALPAASSPVVAALPTLAGAATFVSGTTAAMTGTTSTQIIALVASNRIYVTRIACKNDPANAVGTRVQIRDGVAGTVLDTLSVAANGGGEQGTGATPLFWTTAGTALYAQNVTTSASVICTASGYSG